MSRGIVAILMALSSGISFRAFGCSCVSPELDKARMNADAVFSGTIVRITYVDPKASWEPRVAVDFEVDRVWKGPVTPKFRMHTYSEASSCAGFSPSSLKTGHAILVRAMAGPATGWRPPFRDVSGVAKAPIMVEPEPRQLFSLWEYLHRWLGGKPSTEAGVQVPDEVLPVSDK